MAGRLIYLMYTWLPKNLESISLRQPELLNRTEFWTSWTTRMKRRKVQLFNQTNQGVLRHPSLKTIWTAEISWTTHLNFGELISKASLVFLKSSNKHCLHPAGIERIFSVAGYILSDRRTRTSDDNFENQLFANVNLDLSESRLRKNGNWDEIRTRAAKNENGIIFTNETESENEGC